MRYENFAENECYHIFGKGVSGKNIFLDDKDRARFVFLLTHLQSPVKVNNVSWYTDHFVKKGSFNVGEVTTEKIIKKRNIDLVSFALMSNHFHILIRNLKDGISSVYMHRILTSYSKYFNAKYNKKGHVFDGPFGAVHVENNTQLLHLSAYIHKNPKEIAEWENTYEKYPWSSYQDYIGLNRWGHFLSTDIILEQFADQNKYKEFVLTSTAKEF
jgi:putative transposase